MQKIFKKQIKSLSQLRERHVICSVVKNSTPQI